MKTVGVVGSLALLLSIFGALPAHPQQQKPKEEGAKQKTEKATETPPKRKVPDLSGFDLLEPGKLDRQTIVVGATRGLARPVALAPRLGKLYGAQPLFAWSYEGEKRRFVFVLRDDTQEEIYRAEVDSTEFRYPEDAPALEPGKTYFWAVELSSGIFGSSPSAPAGFLVLSPSQQEEIQQELAQIAGHDTYQAALARARVFTDYRLWYDAIAAYTDLIARYPERAELYEKRGTVYAQLEVTHALADEDFARADQLQRDIQ